jgi:GNAT superfamily N-acetyltransferase
MRRRGQGSDGIGVIRRVVKKAVRVWLGDYTIYRFFRYACACTDADASDTDGALTFFVPAEEEIAQARSPIIREQAWCGGDNALVFAARKGGEIAAICWVWHGSSYRVAAQWPLKEREAYIVQLVTVPEWRGTGTGTQLKRYVTEVLCARGFKTLYSRVWFSNAAAIRMNEKAGWEHFATVVEVTPPKGAHSLRIVRTRR